MKKPSHIRILSIALLAATPAWADRPLLSETADVIGAGDCQFEAWTARTRQSGTPSETATTGFFSCGVAGVHQFGLAGWTARAGGESARGFTLTGKTTLRMPEKGQAGFGVAYALGFDKQPGDSLRAESATVNGVVTQPFDGGLLLHANLGWAYSKSAKASTTFWSVGVEKGEQFTWAADVFGDDRGKPGVSAGVGWAFGEQFSANAAYAMQFEKPRVKQLSVGIKIKF